MGNFSTKFGYYDGPRLDGDIDFPDRPSPLHQWVNGAWVIDLAVAKAAKLVVINQKCTDLLAAIKAGYPDDEVQSWSKQEVEARAYTANNATPTPLLTALAAARQVPIATLAARVIEKADLFTAASGQIIGTRQRYEDQINAAVAAADEAALNAITWS